MTKRPYGPITLDQIADGLAGSGNYVCPSFIPANELRNYRNKLLALKAEDELHKAGIGKADLHLVDHAIRGDYIYWLNEKDPDPTMLPYFEQINRLVKFLNQTCFLDVKDMEFHLAWYPRGTRYARHADRFHHNPHRIISIVSYINDHWLPEYGGQLILFLAGKTIEIFPEPGTAVFFLSDLEHEVCLTKHDRMSITGWLLDQKNDLTFL